jgi:hypothetical protein
MLPYNKEIWKKDNPINFEMIKSKDDYLYYTESDSIAKAVVNKSKLEENKAIAGLPVKRITKIEIKDLLIPAIQIITLGLINTVDFIGIPARELNVKLKLL